MARRKDRKRYSKEFKLQAVKRCDESGKSIAEVARELDISAHMLYRWRDDYFKNPDKAFVGAGNGSSQKSADQKELEKLRRENAKLKEERNILKKSLIFFAKDENESSNS